MADLTYAEALYRRYLRAHPEAEDWLASLPVADRHAALTAWPDTMEGRCFAIADQYDHVAEQSPPTIAARLRAKARAIRGTLRHGE